MQTYEIRLLQPDGPPVIHAQRYLGDFHAIRRAQALAQDSADVEVWRGMDCIYRRETLPHRHLAD
jgi:hypothetical protein